MNKTFWVSRDDSSYVFINLQKGITEKLFIWEEEPEYTYYDGDLWGPSNDLYQPTEIPIECYWILGFPKEPNPGSCWKISWDTEIKNKITPMGEIPSAILNNSKFFDVTEELKLKTQE